MDSMTQTARFTDEQLDAMRAAYATIETVDPKHLTKFHALFAGCNDAALAQLAVARIKFVSRLAVNAQMRRAQP